MVPQTGHITSSSMSGSEVWGSWAAAGAARAAQRGRRAEDRDRAPGARSAPPDQRLDLGLEVLLGHRAAEDERDLAVGVDEDVLRHAGGLELVAVVARAVVEQGVGEPVLVGEGEPLGRGVLGVDAERL